VQFAPVAIGYHDDILTLQTNGPTYPTVALQALATGVGALEDQTALQFGTIASGGSEDINLTIYNYEVAGIVSVNTSINGPSYNIITGGGTENTCQFGISSGDSCTLPVEFDPVAVGYHDDILTITPTGGAASSTINLFARPIELRPDVIRGRGSHAKLIHIELNCSVSGAHTLSLRVSQRYL
jgi:hypothetical protein